MGCDSSGFFSMFSGQSAQCGPVNTQIQQMRGNLDQITGNLERLRGGGGIGAMDRDNQRRSVLTSLMQNNCGPQYANAAANPQGGNFLNNLFGGNNNNPGAPGADLGAPSGTYGPSACAPATAAISRSRSRPRPRALPTTRRPARRCAPRRTPPSTPIAIPAKTSIRRSRSTASPTRRCRTHSSFATSSIRPAPASAQGQTWSDALKSIDEKAEAAQQGDIIVTEESAKKMQQQRLQQQQKAAQGKKGAPPAQAAAPAEAAPPPADTTASSEDKPIRTVGPKFLPDKSGPSVPR